MQRWEIEEKILELKFTWAISRSSTQVKKNFIVKIIDGPFKGEGEVAFNSRYGESCESIINGFNKFRKLIDYFQNGITSKEQLFLIFEKLEIPSSLKFGIESAFIHFLSKLEDQTIQEVLGTDTVKKVRTSFSLPIMPIQELGIFVKNHKLSRFHALKIKVNDTSMVESVKELRNIYKGEIRIDANEAYRDISKLLIDIDKIKNCNISFLEQPFPARMIEDYKKLKLSSDVLIFADESVGQQEISKEYFEMFHGINIKLMKSGGYLKAIKQLRDARALGLKTMLGCMIETSLGISSALNIASGVDYFDLDGSLLIKNDPFHLITEENGYLFGSSLH